MCTGAIARSGLGRVVFALSGEQLQELRPTGAIGPDAAQVAYRSTFRRDEDIELALEAATYGGARALGLERYGLTPGARADLVVVPAHTAAEAVVTRPVRELVLKDGEIVARDGRIA